MQNFKLTLASPVSTSFRCTKAANSLDIDVEKKAVHHFEVSADVKSDFSIGLVVGASGSGKTTFAKHVWGNECFDEILDPKKPVIEQFPEHYSYDECAAMLSGVGLTAVPCWIRPAYTLSNGQRARAECALQMAQTDRQMIVIDEWTSVVDRTVAKVMSHCIQKHARKTGKQIILLSCHYDVAEWLNPDWIIDCNKQEYVDRRLLRREFQRSEKLEFQIREVGRESWKYFSKYHYLSDRLAGGFQLFYGLFVNDDQVGFLAFSNYVPHRKGTKEKMKLHFNRLVIHPDFCGLGIGIKFLDAASEIVKSQGYEVMGKFSSAPVLNSLVSNKRWRCACVERKVKARSSGNMQRGKSGYSRADQAARGDSHGFRLDVKTYSFRYVGDKA